MNMWDRVKSVLGREAADVKDAMKRVGRTLDEELARAERKQRATPEERIDMILEDIDDDEATLSTLEAELGTNAPDRANKRRTPTHQLLEPSDVSDSPNLEDALQMVAVEFIENTTGVGARFSHRIALDSRIEPHGVDIERVASQLMEHTLIGSVETLGVNVLFVDAPTLHVNDVALLTAAAFADDLPGESPPSAVDATD